MRTEEIKEKLAEAFPDADIKVQDTRDDGRHFKVIIASSAFANKSLIDQHRMIYAVLEEERKTFLHALQIETKVKP